MCEAIETPVDVCCQFSLHCLNADATDSLEAVTRLAIGNKDNSAELGEGSFMLVADRVVEQVKGGQVDLERCRLSFAYYLLWPQSYC